ncbi:hypothetical protein C0992_009521 [Termitomyces sp. T32_za158]|nr:hypothetical protein C0992_009521 [Termitomyces sp. T32_za158]
MGGGRGLETVSKTRFGTIIHSAKSVHRNIPIISQVVKRGEFDLSDLGEYFKDSLSGGWRTKTASSFVTILGQLVDIGSPATTVLAHLESNEASPADVFVYWHAFLQATSEVLHDEAQEIPNHVRSEILGILNYHDCQVFVDGNLLDGADVYLAGAYLHPGYLDSDLFKFKHRQATEKHTDLTGVLYPSIFCHVTEFLSKVSQKEIFHGNKPALTRWKGHAKAFKTQFLEEMKKYGRRQPPYNQAFTEQQGIMLWWRSLEDQEFGQILPVQLFEPLFIRANSMAEECTVSILQGGTKQVLKKAMQNGKGLDLGTENDNDNDFTMSL